MILDKLNPLFIAQEEELEGDESESKEAEEGVEETSDEEKSTDGSEDLE